MKVVAAIIKPFKLSEIHDALHAIGVSGLMVCEAKGHGHQKGHSDIYRFVEYVAHYVAKLKIEVIAPDDRVEDVVKAIASAAKTGAPGDGKIYVHALDQVVRIRTGETGERAV
jgi:nitrogen regulatory protein PII